MKRGVNDGDVLLHLVDGILVYNLCFYMGDVFVINLFADNLVKACCHGILCAHGLHGGQILNGQNLFRYTLVMRRSKLSAVLPVYLIAVILRRVVACGYVNAGNAA